MPLVEADHTQNVNAEVMNVIWGVQIIRVLRAAVHNSSVARGPVLRASGSARRIDRTSITRRSRGSVGKPRESHLGIFFLLDHNRSASGIFGEIRLCDDELGLFGRIFVAAAYCMRFFPHRSF